LLALCQQGPVRASGPDGQRLNRVKTG